MFEKLIADAKKTLEERKKRAGEDREKNYRSNLDRIKYLRAEKARIDAENHLLESKQKNRELRRSGG